MRPASTFASKLLQIIAAALVLQSVVGCEKRVPPPPGSFAETLEGRWVAEDSRLERGEITLYNIAPSDSTPNTVTLRAGFSYKWNQTKMEKEVTDKINDLLPAPYVEPTGGGYHRFEVAGNDKVATAKTRVHLWRIRLDDINDQVLYLTLENIETKEIRIQDLKFKYSSGGKKR